MESVTEWCKQHPQKVALAIGVGVAVVGGLYYLKGQAAKPAVASLSTDSKAVAAPKSEEQVKNAEEALAAKNEGNAEFKSKNFHAAIKHYTRAIELSLGDESADISAPYCNRAACHLILKNFQDVIDDCTAALEAKPLYEKALNRRAQAYESLGHLRGALHDYTALCILKKFQDQELMQNVDRILKAHGHAFAVEHVKQRQPFLPGIYSINVYLESFPSLPEEQLSVQALTDLIVNEPNNGDLYRRRAQANVQIKDFDKVLADADAAVSKLQALMDGDAEDKPAVQQQLLLALELQGAFRHLYGDSAKALESFSAILALNPENIGALLRRSTTLLEQGSVDDALYSLNVALAAAPSNVYTHYHRAQAWLVKENTQEAIEDFTKSVELNPTFPAPYIQLALSALKVKGPQIAQDIFKTAMERFPKDGDVYTYQAQMMLQLQNTSEMERLLKLGEERNPISPLPNFFRAQIALNMNNFEEAFELLLKVIDVDPKFDAAYQQLAQLSLQKKDMPKALEYFQKVIDLARTLDDMSTAFACREAALAQLQLISSSEVLRNIVMAL